ncbi:MAG: MBL fold metallo-hydrolase [Clostridiales bacterium]|nr:MBL fold metallo-hydrolase [Clostridiales bacterium]
MKLSFLGAAHEVTGSCHFIEACGKKILVDCGMQQGQDDDTQELPVVPADIDYLFLTHAHIDHSGKLPLLSKMGFNGKIFTTVATGELCSIMLQDSAHIQEFEAEWKNRKRQRAGEDLYEPLYTIEDAQRIMKRFVTFEYNQIISVCDGIKIRFIDVGHLLGSASIEVWIEEEDTNKKLVFSGDIGNLNQPLIRDPQYITEADYVVMESTYGDRNHGPAPDYVQELADIIKETFDQGGNVVIPSFAVGRTQELLYFLRDIVNNNRIPGYSEIPVYVDSPLAVEATNVFNKNVKGYFDEEAMSLINQGINPITFPGLKISVTSDESKAINFDSRSKVIISASGMCDAGRIRHHLKHNLWRAESTIVFVGFQAIGTLGRSLLEGTKTVKLFGESITVNANIVRLHGISGHADQAGLLRWLSAFEQKPKRVFVVHGEASVCDSFAALLQDQGYDAMAPNLQASFDLATNTCLETGVLPEPKKVKETTRVSGVFQRLVNAGQRLMAVIRHNEGGANKDLAKFADQINSLCDKWDR